MIEANLLDLSMILPEIVLALGAMLLLMYGVFTGDRSAPAVNAAAVVLAIAIGALAMQEATGTTLGGAFVVDGFSRFMKIAALVGSAVAIVLAQRFARIEGFERFEYPVIILLAALGMLVMISAN